MQLLLLHEDDAPIFSDSYHTRALVWFVAYTTGPRVTLLLACKDRNDYHFI